MAADKTSYKAVKKKKKKRPIKIVCNLEQTQLSNLISNFMSVLELMHLSLSRNVLLGIPRFFSLPLPHFLEGLTRNSRKQSHCCQAKEITSTEGILNDHNLPEGIDFLLNSK